MTRKPALSSRLGFVVALASIAPVLPADETAAPPQNYHDVKVQAGGQTTVVRVQNSAGPRLHGEPPANGPYNPESMDLSRTSSFSKQAFSTRDSALSKNDTAAEAGHSFLTKSYSGGKPDAGFNRIYRTASYVPSARAGGDFQKSFATSASSLAGTRDAFAGKTSSYQGRTATLGGPKTPPFAGLSNLGDKTFSDPELTHVRRDPYASANNLDVSRLVDLPNRPLTIDEVRNLINHETIPNLETKPEPPSKPLNDPGYEPPTAASLPHEEMKAPGPEEKDDSLPSPGMMAAPENSEPLPK